MDLEKSFCLFALTSDGGSTDPFILLFGPLTGSLTADCFHQNFHSLVCKARGFLKSESCGFFFIYADFAFENLRVDVCFKELKDPNL